MPSSCDNCRIVAFKGGNIRFKTAAFRSGEYPMPSSSARSLENYSENGEEDNVPACECGIAA